MAVTTTLAACNVNPALNGPDGASDLPSTLDDAIRNALSFIAQLRDGAGIQVGMISAFATLTAPLGFLKLNGQLVSRTTYANLFAFASGVGLVSEATWNAGYYGLFSVGDGSTNFRLPDMRGEWMRGLDEGRGIDPGRTLGLFQAQQLIQHAHGVSDPTHAHSVADPTHAHAGTTDTQGYHSHPYTATTAGGGTSSGGLGFQIYAPQAANVGGDGNHAHNFGTDGRYTGIGIYGAGTGISIQNSAGGAENRVRGLAYPFYVKY